MRAPVMLWLFASLLCGVVYPLVATLGAQLLAPVSANGSLAQIDGRTVGSQHIGQLFLAPGYLWGRPSATKTPYAPCQPDLSAGSSGSNLGPLHPDLRAAVAARIDALRTAARAVGAEATLKVPIDLVTASGSGLDPHVSLAAAEFQVERIANARGASRAQVRTAIAAATHGRQFAVLGEPVVHVLQANLNLDAALGRMRR